MKKLYHVLKVSMLLLVFAITSQAFAQVVTISGKVTDAKDGSSIPGATVRIKGTSQGAITDIDGNYSISVNKGASLEFSFVGYQKQEVVITNQTKIDITLQLSSASLSEVVVIGYGQVKKGDATGSVVAVNSKDFNKGNITSAQELLVGKIAGVVISTGGGAPGGGASIRIRGGSSLNASNSPLIIIDGVPISNNGASGDGNFLSFVNPNDIESFTVLKDASATAIYGSRASNGVILITTKKGVAGAKTSITYSVNTSLAVAVKYLDVYSGDEMRQIASSHKDLFGVDNLGKLGSQNTNWQKEIYREAISMDHNLSATGVLSKNVPYRVSVGYDDENGILKNTEMKRLTGSVNLDPSFLKNTLKVNVNLKGMYTNWNFADQGAVGSAMAMDPTQPVKDGNPSTDGYFQWPTYGANLGTPNPVEQLLATDNKSYVGRFVGGLQMNYALPFIPGLKANLNLATDYTNSQGHNNRPVTAPSTLVSPTWGMLTNFSSKNYNNLLDFYLNYTKDLGPINKIDLTAGYSWQHFKRQGNNYSRGVIGTGHPYVLRDSSSFITENYLVSFFGRLNYTLLDRYLLTFTLRDDGSSRFAKGNQWGLFPSAAFAWKINNEPFLKNVKALSNLKLRLGWGVTGQQDVGNDYPAQARYQVASRGSYYLFDGTYLPTLRPNAYDPNIKWEECTTQNIGLDFGFMNERINGSFDYYFRKTTNLLNTVTVPTMSNFSNTLLTNVGSLENRGAEFTLNLVPISKNDVTLNLGFNVGYNKNTITKLLITDDPNYPGIMIGDAFNGIKQVTKVGYAPNSFFVNKQVYDANGNPIEGLYVDLSGKGGAVNGNNNDKYIYHNPVADYLMGFSFRFNYKSFDLSASTRASIGNYIFSQVGSGSSYDQMQQIGYWKNMPRILSETNFVKRQFTTDFYVQNGSFFKVDNVSAGYNFKDIGGKVHFRVSFTVQNLLTVTKYNGIDPEVPGGVDNNFYPRPRTYMLGISLGF